jgi:hypothetical protein
MEAHRRRKGWNGGRNSREAQVVVLIAEGSPVCHMHLFDCLPHCIWWQQCRRGSLRNWLMPLLLVISFFWKEPQKICRNFLLKKTINKDFKKEKTGGGLNYTLHPKTQLHKQLYNLRRKQLGNNQTKEKEITKSVHYSRDLLLLSLLRLSLWPSSIICDQRDHFCYFQGGMLKNSLVTLLPYIPREIQD